MGLAIGTPQFQLGDPIPGYVPQFDNEPAAPPPAVARTPGSDTLGAATPPAPKFSLGNPVQGYTPEFAGAPAAYDPASDYAITRGFKAGVQGAEQAPAAFVDMSRIAQLPLEQQAAEMLKTSGVVDPAAVKMQMGGIEDIGTRGGYFADTLTFIGESVGQMAGNMFGAAETGGVAGAGAGAVVGGVAGGVAGAGIGALPGAVAGAGTGAVYGMGASYVTQGITGAYQDLLSDEGVRKGLKDGSVSPQEVFQWSIGAGTIIGLLDILPQERLLERMGGKKIAKGTIKKGIIKAAVSGARKQAVEEGGTEALQGAISEVGQAGIGGDANVGQRALSVLNQGLAGSLGAFAPGAIGGVTENAQVAKETQNDQANPQTPPGIDTAVAAAAGQSTPGGAGVTPTAPPGAPAQAGSTDLGHATPAQAAPITVVAKGQTEPTLAAVLSPEAAPLPPPAGVALGGVAAPEATPPAVTEASDVEDPQAVIAHNADLEALNSTKSILADLLKNIKRDAAATPIVPAGQDTAAALAATQPEQSPPQVAPPAMPTPTATGAAPAPAPAREPLGTPEAAARRALPQAPVEGAPAPLVQPVAQPTPPLAAFQTQPQAAPTAAPALTLGEPMPAAARAALATPEAAAPVLSPIGRELAGQLRQELFSDPLSENPSFNDVVDQVALQHTVNAPRGMAPRQAVRQALAPALEAVRTRLGEQVQQEAVAQATQGQQALEKASTIAKSRGRADRAAGKPAVALASEPERATQRAVYREMIKPEAQRDPNLVEYGRLWERRKKLPSKGKENIAERAALTEQMQAVQKRRVEAQAAVEPKPTPQPAEGSVSTEVVKPGLTEAQAATEQEAKRHAKALARTAKNAPAVKAAVGTLTTPNWARMSLKTAITEGLPYITAYYHAVRDTLGKAGDKIGENISRNNSPEENLAIFAREIIGKRKHPGFTAVEFGTAQVLIQDNAIDDFFNMVSSEQIAGTTGALESILENPEDATYDEGSNQFLQAPPAPGAGTVHLFQASNDRPVIDVKVDRRSTTAKVLDEVRATIKDVARTSGFASLISRMHVKMLKALVGEVPVIFVSPDDMTRMIASATGKPATPRGFYLHLGDSQRAAGRTPAIYIDNDSWVTMGTWERLHVILHEATHAATARAIEKDIRGAGSILRSIRSQLVQHLLDNDIYNKLSPTLRYGLKDAHEFVAEAFSNPDFQHLLAETPLPAKMARNIGYTMTDRRQPTWWRAFMSAVSNAIGFHGLGERGMTYLDAVVKVYPMLQQSEADQQRAVEATYGASMGLAKKLAARHNMSLAAPRSAFDVQALMFDTRVALAAVKGKAGTRPWSRASRYLATRIATTMDMTRSTEELFGGLDNPFKKLAYLFLSQRHIRNRYRQAGDDLSRDLLDYVKLNHAVSEKMVDIYTEATMNELDPAKDLAAHKHVFKTGVRDARRRALHKELRAAWQTLPAPAKALMQRLVDHHAAQENLRVEKLLRNIVNQAVDKFNVSLPAGEDVKSVIQWVLNGDVDKPAPADPKNVQANERTARDEGLHKALGKTAETLVGTKSMRKVRGVYLPLVRWGKYYFSARHKVAVPAGAALDPTAKHANMMIFADEKKAIDYLEKTDEQIESVITRWLDPLTGKITQKVASYVGPGGALVNPVKAIYVTVQNHTMVMDDNQARLAQMRDQYTGPQWQSLSEVGLIDSVMHANNQILPQQVNRLINNIQQSSVGAATVGQQANVNAVVNAYIKTLASGRAVKRRLKRRNVGGFSRDLVQSTLTANHIMAGHLTNLDIAPQMAAADDEIDKYIQDHKNDSVTPMPMSTLWRQEYIRALRDRITAVQTRNEDNWGARLMNVVMNLSFMRHLFTPSYVAMNAVQPFGTTYPVLAAKFGDGATVREMTGAYWDLGAAGTMLRGAKETVHETRKLFSKAHEPHHYHKDIYARVAKLADGALFRQAMDQLELLGLGSSGGIEAADIHEAQRTDLLGRFVENPVDRASRIARALPEAGEAVNRYTTALAAMRLAKRKGMSDAAAVDYAVTTVEQTQGGYAAENNPAFMSHKIARVPLQFKKYSLMYGQLFYGNLVRMLNTDNDPVARKEAAKSVVRLAATTIAMAGVGGLPFIELGRVMLFVYDWLAGDDDTWQEWENNLQGWTADALKWAHAGETVSNDVAESMWHGASRMLGFDTSSRLGNDSMVLFGDPKSMDKQGVEAWLFDMILGAPGGLASDIIAGVHDRDYVKALPLPKFMIDLWKAVHDSTNAKVTPGGHVLAPPIKHLEAFWQAMGFRPASQAEAFETGGGAAQRRSDKKLSADRSTVMGAWSAAKGAVRQKIWRTEIRAWNKAHPSKKDRIEMGDLQRSAARRKQLEKMQ